MTAMRQLAACALAAGLALATAVFTGPTDSRAGPGATPPWRVLVFEDANGVTEVRTEVRLAPVSGEQAAAALAPGPGALAPPDGARLSLLTAEIRSESPWPLPDKAWRGSVWFDAESGAALQRVRERLTPTRYQKIYRYGRDGVRRTRTEPDGAAEASLAPGRWTRVEPPRDLAYPAERAGCAGVGDPSLLLLAVSTPGWDVRREPVALCVFNKKRVHAVRIERAGEESVDVQYARRSGDREQRVAETVRAAVLKIGSRPLPGDASPEPLELLGIEGDVEILVDAPSGLPVRIRGRVPDFGTADFRLVEVVLAAGG